MVRGFWGGGLLLGGPGAAHAVFTFLAISALNGHDRDHSAGGARASSERVRQFLGGDVEVRNSELGGAPHEKPRAHVLAVHAQHI